jgi:hypothetical protein
MAVYKNAANLATIAKSLTFYSVFFNENQLLDIGYLLFIEAWFL